MSGRHEEEHLNFKYQISEIAFLWNYSMDKKLDLKF